MAFIIAGIIIVLSALWFLLQMGAAAMSDNPSASDDLVTNAKWSFAAGIILAAIIAATHYLKHIPW